MKRFSGFVIPTLLGAGVLTDIERRNHDFDSCFTEVDLVVYVVENGPFSLSQGLLDM